MPNYPSLHTPPPRAGGPLVPPFTQQQLQQISKLLIDYFIGQIAIGLGAVEFFGWHPFEALIEIGEKIQEAKANFDAIFAAVSAGDISGLVAWLQAIPGSVITGITVIEQQILNAIAAALGHPAPPDRTPTDIQGYLAAIPQAAVTNLVAQLTHVGPTGLYDATAGFANQATSLLKYLTPTGGNIGFFDASALTGALNSAVTYGGTALSTFFENINSSGEIIAAGITGALNTGVTVAGNGIGTLLSNIDATGQFLGSAITGAINTAATVSGQAIGTIQANAQGVVNGINNAAAGLLSGGSALLADAETNLANLFGSAPAYLQGLFGATGQQATNDAYAATAAAAAAQAAELARQQSAFNAVFNVSPSTSGNVSVTVDFSTIANQPGMSGIMLPGTGSGANFMGVTSGQAVTQPGSMTGMFDLEVFPTQTTSDYQVIDLTIGSLNDILTLGNIVAAIFRCDSSRGTYGYVMLYPSSGSIVAQLGCRVSGGSNIVFSTSAPIAAASGGKIRVIAGDPSSLSPYAMQVLYNGTPIITYTDSSHTSQIGATQRYVGLAESATTGCTSPSARTVTYQDNPPPPSAYPFSGRPAADTDAKGRVYVSSDCGRMDRDNGGAWENIYLGPAAFANEPPSFASTIGSGGTFSADKDARLLSLATGTFSWNVEYQAISPASNYICRAYFETLPFLANDNFQGPSLILYDSVSGKLISWGYGYDPSSFKLQAAKWNSITSFNSAYVNTNIADAVGYGINWWQIRDDGTNRYFEYSFNGVDFYTEGSSGRTDFITPTHIGWGGARYSSTTYKHRCRSFKQG